jgi:solute carrier family 25 phosphate transporter 3
LASTSPDGALTPVDVVKTRIQLGMLLFFSWEELGWPASFLSVRLRFLPVDPIKYNKGMITTFGTIVKEEGAGALLTGLGPTIAGYFIQGAFKFGGYVFFFSQVRKFLPHPKNMFKS